LIVVAADPILASVASSFQRADAAAPRARRHPHSLSALRKNRKLRAARLAETLAPSRNRGSILDFPGHARCPLTFAHRLTVTRINCPELAS
jgi:hypothetical protein